MMEYQLTIPALLRHTEVYFPTREIACPTGDGSLFRYDYAQSLVRSRKLGLALTQLGLAPGSRVATLCWNHQHHLECYFGIPSSGLVLHTLNPRLPSEDLAFIMQDAQDSAIVVDQELLPLLKKIGKGHFPGHVIVIGDGIHSDNGMVDYEKLLASVADPGVSPVEPREDDAAAMCHTSGTTGRPKGIVYSHRAIVLHSLACALPNVFSLGQGDSILPAVPMFHANAWGLPYTAALVGARQVLARSSLDPVNLLSLLASERVTFSAGVPTIWLGVLDELDAKPGCYDLSRLKTVVVGGGACPPSLIQGLEERHGLRVVTSWGMTEMTPVGTIGTDPRNTAGEGEYMARARPGRAIPLVEMRTRKDETFAAWDGVSMGELEVRGPCIAREYYGGVSPESFTTDGWFRTGDIATLDNRGVLEIRDRAKDLIKSGGEWISSVTLENALIDHPAVAEAAVIAVPDPKWQERPLAIVVAKSGEAISEESLIKHLASRFPSWYLPNRVLFVGSIPRTASGKVMKNLLRTQLADIRFQ